MAVVIEISDTTLSRDRGIKLRSYARAGIANYVLINLPERRIELYSEPTSAGTDPTYRSCHQFDASRPTVEFAVAATTLQIELKDLLPTSGD